LVNEYYDPKERMGVKKMVYFASQIGSQFADIVVFQEDLKHYHVLFAIKMPDPL
jgi:hypothetical protein